MSFSNLGQGVKAVEFLSEFILSIKIESYLILFPVIVSFSFYTIFQKRFKINKIIKSYNKKIKKQNDKFVFIKKNLYVLLLIFIFVSIYICTLNLKFMQNKYQVIPNNQLIILPSNSNLAIKQFGVGIYFLSDVSSIIFDTRVDLFDYNEEKIKNKKINKDKYNVLIENDDMLSIINSEVDPDLNNINKYLITSNASYKNEMTGIFKNKNLIVVLMESVNMMAIDEKSFPTIYKLYNEGISFKNNYSPRSSCSTSNSEMATMTGIIPLNDYCIVGADYSRENTYFQSIFNVFRKNGYSTSSYHGYPDQYYTRSRYHKLVGSEKYYTPDDLKMKYYKGIVNWSSDVELIEKSVPYFIDEDKFMSYIITVTTHMEYTNNSIYSDKYADMWDDTNYNDKVKRYLSKLKETDLALEKLLEELEEEDKLDDTVIALFADHYPIGLERNEIRSVLGKEMDNAIHDFDKTPMMIYSSELDKPINVEKYTTITDLLPTLLNLFGVEFDSRLYMGNDVFSNYDDFALFADGSWRNKNGYYDVSTSKFTFTNGSKNYSLTELTKINNINLNKIYINRLILENNYYEYLEKKLKEYSND